MSEVDRTLKKIKNARAYCDKIIKESKNLKEVEDAEFLKDNISELVGLMSEYTESVFDDKIKNATRQKILEESNTIRDYQEKCEIIEIRRKNVHDGLITQIKVTDNLCKTVGVDEIYGRLPEEYREDTSGLMGKENREKPGVVEIRHAITDWAFEVVLGSTVAMTLDLAEIDYDNNFEDNKKVAEEFRRLGGVRGAKKMIDDMTRPEGEER